MVMPRRSSEGAAQRWLLLVALASIACFAIYFTLSPLFATPIPGAAWSDAGAELARSSYEMVEDVAACCKGVEHQELWGSVAKWGTDHRVNSSRDCCLACKAMCADDGPCLCNSWVYCGDERRCGDKYRQCWLKKQEDMLSPDVQESHSEVFWTSGLVYGNKGIIALETKYGAIHLKLLPDCAPLSVAYILELLKLRHCAGCQIYRAEGRGIVWDEEGRQVNKDPAGPPYALLQGSLEAQGFPFKELPLEACPIMKRGMVGWIGGGPDFFISLANHGEWSPKHTVFATVLREDMVLVEKLALLPTTWNVWNGIKVSVLNESISLKVKRSMTLEI